jgi:hypothetical protein
MLHVAVLCVLNAAQLWFLDDEIAWGAAGLKLERVLCDEPCGSNVDHTGSSQQSTALQYRRRMC